MAALPYMPLFVADYLADTRHLTPAQHGAYLLLIMNYWQTGKPLPNDDARLARIAGMSKRDWAHNRAAILDFFTEQENLLVHNRITLELSRVADKSLKSKRAAQASVQRRFSGRSADVEPTDTEKEKEDTLAKANGGNAADSDQIFWSAAKDYLAPESKNPGSLVGRWCRDYGKPQTAEAITRAQLERPIQRIPFIEGALRAGKRRTESEYRWESLA